MLRLYPESRVPVGRLHVPNNIATIGHATYQDDSYLVLACVAQSHVFFLEAGCGSSSGSNGKQSIFAGALFSKAPSVLIRRWPHYGLVFT